MVTQFSSPIIHHSNFIFSPTQNKTCLDSFLVLCNSKFCNNGGTYLLYWVRQIYLPTRVSSLSSSFSFFLSSLLCLTFRWDLKISLLSSLSLIESTTSLSHIPQIRRNKKMRSSLALLGLSSFGHLFLHSLSISPVLFSLQFFFVLFRFFFFF